MNAPNPTKKQHFVPEFYLKFFADREKKIQILDIKNNRLCQPKSPSGVGYSSYFYAVKTGIPDEASQLVEKWLQRYEDTIAEDLPKIIDKISDYKHIDNDDRYTLSALMCMLWLRSPNMRTQLNNMNEDISKKVMGMHAPQRVDSMIEKIGVKMSEVQRAELIKTLKTGSYKLHFNNVGHLRFMTEYFGFGGPGFINMFYGHKWKIYIAKGKERFITTDTPVVEWWLPPRTFYGASFLERNKYFALTPEIFIELTYPLGSDKIKHKTIFDDNDDIVKLFNMLLATHSYEFAYSADKELLKSLISSRKNPGVIEQDYYKRFQLPWDVARREGRL
jgi:hypothetical protein